jgi:hypothetical protein
MVSISVSYITGILTNDLYLSDGSSWKGERAWRAGEGVQPAVSSTFSYFISGFDDTSAYL